MKKYILVLSLFILTISIYAQNEIGSVTIQPKVGFNITDYANDPDTDLKLGLVAGVEFEKKATDRFGLAAGLVYSAQGSKVSSSGITTTIQTDYINIPIIVNIFLSDEFAIKFGIQPGFNINNSYEMKGSGVTVSGSMSDIGFDIQPFDFSVPIGLSFERNKFIVDARYNIGLTKIFNGYNDKNIVFQFTLGYKLDL